MPTKIANQASEQIAILRKLHPRAAAYLANCSHGSLRDRTDQIQPDEQGLYDAQAVARWAGKRFGALALSDADLEELLRLAEAIAYDLSVSCFALSRILPDYLQRHGPHGANVLLNEVADVLRDDCYLDAAEVEALPETQRLVAKLQTSVVCDGCGRTRFGAKWKKLALPAPDKYLLGRCDACD